MGRESGGGGRGDGEAEVRVEGERLVGEGGAAAEGSDKESVKGRWTKRTKIF